MSGCLEFFTHTHTVSCTRRGETCIPQFVPTRQTFECAGLSAYSFTHSLTLFVSIRCAFFLFSFSLCYLIKKSSTLFVSKSGATPSTSITSNMWMNSRIFILCKKEERSNSLLRVYVKRMKLYIHLHIQNSCSEAHRKGATFFVKWLRSPMHPFRFLSLCMCEYFICCVSCNYYG